MWTALGACAGYWMSHDSTLVLGLVVFAIVIGGTLSRSILVMAAARWDQLIRLEIDWSLALVAAWLAPMVASRPSPWGALLAGWIAGALLMFWVTFVARAIEK